MNWKFWKKEEKQIEENTPELSNEELELMREKANVEAIKIYNKIYRLFKEHINELKEGDNFILLQENHIKLCDDKDLNDFIIFESIYYNRNKLRESIPELHIIYGKEIKGMNDVFLGFEEYYLYTITITHDDIIESYDIKFRVHPLEKQINNGNGICVTIHGIDKNIYKIIS